eukprot:GEMP01018453.1.p1 GENE.GEMP01018453.1~~GEMP01018453.1.p1  ORF type:complete len:274 (+),score=47.32 GEMP01018453.1:132-953(+)
MGNCSAKNCFDFILNRQAQPSTIQTNKPHYWRIGAGNHKIVVGIGAKDFGGSTQCLNFALQLANEGDEVVALHVRTDVGDILDRLAELEHVYDTEIKSKKIKYETIVTKGNARHELLSKSLDADMLMVGAGHKGFGSMTRFVCEYAKVNVVVVKKIIKLDGKILVGIGANDLYGSLSALKLAFDIANNGEEISALYIPVSTNTMGGEWKNREVLGRKSLEIGRQANDVIRMVRERANTLKTSFAEEGKTVTMAALQGAKRRGRVVARVGELQL